MNVLLSSASNKVPLLLALKDAVRRITPNGLVTAGDINTDVLTRHFCDTFWHMPATTEANIERVIAALKQQNITHVLPTRDGELYFWALLKERLKTEHIHVIVSKPDAVELCLDKLRFSRLNLPTIIPAYIDAPTTNTSNDTLRYVVKERFGAGSKSIGINLNATNALNHAKSLASPIYQPFIEGQEISVDAWLSKDHVVKAAMCRVRAVVVNGESQVTYTLPQAPFLPEIIETLSLLKLSGPVVIQAIIKDNRAHVIECNSRFGGASTLGIKAGVDCLYWSLCESVGKNVNAIPVNLSDKEITQVRAASDYYL